MTPICRQRLLPTSRRCGLTSRRTIPQRRNVLRSNVETLLPNSPEMARPGRVPGTREFVIPRTPYIVPYRLVGNTIQVLRVFHSARRWPEAF